MRSLLRRLLREPIISLSLPNASRFWNSSAPIARASIPRSASTGTSAGWDVQIGGVATTGLIQGQIDFTIFDRDREGEAQQLAARHQTH